MPEHHDYRLDKDTVESVRQLIEQDTEQVLTSQHGLPSNDRLDDETLYTFAQTPEADTADLHLYGHGTDRALPNEFRSSKSRKTIKIR